MSEVLLTLALLGLVFNLARSFVKEKAPGKPWYRNHIRNLEVASLLLTGAIVVVSYLANNRQRQRARANEASLNAEISALNGQNGRLLGQIGDCNSRIMAVAEKLHAPPHLYRSASESIRITDSVSVKKQGKRPALPLPGVVP